MLGGVDQWFRWGRGSELTVALAEDSSWVPTLTTTSSSRKLLPLMASSGTYLHSPVYPQTDTNIHITDT